MFFFLCEARAWDSQQTYTCAHTNNGSKAVNRTRGNRQWPTEALVKAKGQRMTCHFLDGLWQCQNHYSCLQEAGGRMERRTETFFPSHVQFLFAAWEFYMFNSHPRWSLVFCVLGNPHASVLRPPLKPRWGRCVWGGTMNVSHADPNLPFEAASLTGWANTGSGCRLLGTQGILLPVPRWGGCLFKSFPFLGLVKILKSKTKTSTVKRLSRCFQIALSMGIFSFVLLGLGWTGEAIHGWGGLCMLFSFRFLLFYIYIYSVCI